MHVAQQLWQGMQELYFCCSNCSLAHQIDLTAVSDNPITVCIAIFATCNATGTKSQG
jgi:hypothetical protein